MATLDGLGGVAAVAMHPRPYVASERDDRSHRLHIWLVMVSKNLSGKNFSALGKGGLEHGNANHVLRRARQDLHILS